MTVFESICLLLCGVGVFLTGMKLMGDGLSKSSAKSIRSLFNKVSNNRLASYGIGAGATAIVQSSAATTVMSMGLVGAGIMSATQASAFVLGARLGTTATGILVSLSSISITPVLMAMAFVGICLVLFVNNDGVKAVGYVIGGLGVLFAGMKIMTQSITEQAQISAFFIGLFNAIDFPLLLVLVGAVFTAIIQSSSATTGILITLINAGTLDVSQGIFIVIGATIGTCFTALIASLGTDKEAQKIAVFNVFTAIIGAILIGGLIWALKKYVVILLSFIGSPQWELSLFGVFYSLLASLVCLPFITPLQRLLSKLIKEKKKTEEFSCFFIEEKSLKTPAVALIQVQKETENLAELARANLSLGFEILHTQDEKYKKRVEIEENRIDFITKKISEFLVQLAGKNLPYKDELLVGSLHHVVDDIERIGDHGVDLMKMGLKMKRENVLFSDVAFAELIAMRDKVDELYAVSLEAFSQRKKSALYRVDALEQQVDDLKKIFSARHVDRLNAGACTIETGTYFYTALANLERVGDHLENIAYSIKSITGSVEK